MINAKEELIKHIEEYSLKLKCASITHEKSHRSRDISHGLIELNVNHTTDDSDKFFEKLDFSYDNGFGLLELCGTLWYEDGSYSIRHEYECEESWVYCICPDIPEHLL